MLIMRATASWILGVWMIAPFVQAQNTDAPATGFAAKKPVFGGACNFCPWGAIADIVKAAMAPYGYDVQICYNCSGRARAARLVAAAARPARPATPTNEAPIPDGPIDFGATGAQFLWWAYQGTHDYADDPDGPRKQLRMVANIQDPTYLLTAVKADSKITDLHQILTEHLPVRILATGVGGGHVQGGMTQDVLAYYGLTAQAVASLGGRIITGSSEEDQKNADVVIGLGTLSNAPEYSLWNEISQKYDLRFLELPGDLRARLAKDFDLEERKIPVGLLHGVDRAIPTVVRTGTVIYGRTDMPDDFAYTLAKAIDEHQDLLQWSNMNFSYNSRSVWKSLGTPLHPGAARYYRERGYIK
jgi:uncharacterized protein